MDKKIESLLRQYKNKIPKLNSGQELEEIRIKLLGRKGIIKNLFSQISRQPIDLRKKRGQQLNQAKQQLEKLIAKQTKIIKTTKAKVATKEKKVYRLKKIGHLHPLTVIENQINRLFQSMGFSIYDGPEIETDEYCFQRLNVPDNHPARDLQDSIFIKQPKILLRTQTSSIEARLLEKETPPFRAAFPGRAYRNEKVNRSNHFIFNQYQGVAVDKDISLKHLIGVFDRLIKHLYGENVVARYRCKYYPEVEPGLGLDLQCFSCQAKGCRLCKNVGWIEIGGAGIIHPKVMSMAGLDPVKWRGFAFGLGLDRLVMAKYKIKDIRTLQGGNLAYKPNVI